MADQAGPADPAANKQPAVLIIGGLGMMYLSQQRSVAR